MGQRRVLPRTTRNRPTRALHDTRRSDVGDPKAFAAYVGETMLAVNEPVAGVWTAVTAAAHGDREVRGNLAERLASIRRQVENVLCVITSVESYVRYVRMDGKSPEEYQAFVARTVHDTILLRHSKNP